MKSSTNCCDFVKCMEYLNLILDNEATEEQEKYVISHIEKCLVCFEQYELETQVRELIKTRIAKRPVPENLAAEIRLRIRSVTI